MGLISRLDRKRRQLERSALRDVTRTLSSINFSQLSALSLIPFGGAPQPELATLFALGSAIQNTGGGGDSIVSGRRFGVVPTGAPRDTPPAPLPEPPSVPSFGSAPAGSTFGGLPVQFLAQLGSGISQQTPAVRALFAKATGARGGRKSARRRKAKASAAPRKKKRARVRGNKFTKGSAAAKRHMAKLRKMRKRK